jgi:hypothetical protein
MAKEKNKKPQIQRSVYIDEEDFNWLKEYRYSLTEILREKIAELKLKEAK